MSDQLDQHRVMFSPTCFNCIHLQDDEKYKCKAFELIPDEIWEGENDHTKPFKGDNGILFKGKVK